MDNTIYLIVNTVHFVFGLCFAPDLVKFLKVQKTPPFLVIFSCTLTIPSCLGIWLCILVSQFCLVLLCFFSLLLDSSTSVSDFEVLLGASTNLAFCSCGLSIGSCNSFVNEF